MEKLLYIRRYGFKFLKIELLPIEMKSVEVEASKAEEKTTTKAKDANLPIVVDVRTPEEFQEGAYPVAINIPLDDLQMRISELGSKSREITLYCASGARSAYAQRVLHQLGFTNTKNGGGIMQMMSQR